MRIIQKIVQKVLKEYGDHSIEEKLRIQANYINELSHEVKKQKGERIHVVFVCHRGALWNSLKTVFEACNSDDEFEVTIVTIPNKKQLPKLGLSHEEYESEGAEEYFKDYPCRVINGYDYENKKWFNLESLKPDYVFFQTAYDICRPPQYKSDVVSLYTRIAYVHYGMPFMGGMIAEESFPKNFLQNTYFHFAEFKEMQNYYVNRVPENAIHKHKNILLTGYPKLDGTEKYHNVESVSWKHSREDGLFRVMWTPRWNTGEGNCTFFELKDKFPKYVEDKGDMELLFRPHPQAFLEYIEKKEMTPEEVEAYKAIYENSTYMGIDPQADYLPSFYSSDVLVADESSIMPEYFLTGKPIIFTYKQTNLNDFATKLSEGFYWAKNMEEVIAHIENLKKGIDPLKDKRKELINTEFYIPQNGSGFEIKEALKADFNNER